MEKYSTRQAAKKLKLSMATLNKYIAKDMIPIPPLVRVGPVSVRLWSDEDIRKVKEILPTLANGRKHRKKRSKSSKKK
jgi:hypothetical protein